MYAIVEFDKDHGGGVCAINSTWLTPKKKEAFWPPYKDQTRFDKALVQCEAVDENNWQLYSVARIFYETDDVLKAKRKAKEAQVTSNLESEEELNRSGRQKRKLKPTRKICESSSDEECSNSFDELARPPPVKRPTSSTECSNSLEPERPSALNRYIYSNELESEADFIDVQRPRVMQSQQTPKSTSRDVIRNNFSVKTTPSEGGTLSNQSSVTVSDKLVALVSTIKEQNDQILAWIAKQSNNNTNMSFGMPDIPFTFPIQTVEQLDELNIYLTNNIEKFDSLRSYLATLGGNSVSSKTNRILKHLLLDSVTVLFNYFGQRSVKRAFSELILKDLVIGAVKKGIPNTSDKEVEDTVKVWLKHSQERLKKKNAQKNNT